MEEAIEQFRSNIIRIRNLGALANALEAQTTGVLDFSDIWRAELVLAVSAFDHYVHEITRLGMLDAYRGNRQKSAALLRFPIAMAHTLAGIADPSGDDWLDQAIRDYHGHQSFQNPDNIAAAIRLISDVQLWNEVASNLQSDSASVREQLRIIVARRNQIAHEADTNPSYPNMRWPIDDRMATHAVDFLEAVAEAIYEIVA